MSRIVIFPCIMILSYVLIMNTSVSAVEGIVIDSISVPSRVGSVAIDDFDLDGYLDIVQRRSDSTVHLLINNKDKSFTDITIGNVYAKHSSWGAVYMTGMSTGDFNGDLYPDIVMINNGDTIHILMNNGDSTFTPNQIVFTDPSTRCLAIDCADVNNDGCIDFAVSIRKSIYPDSVEIYVNDCAGNFSLWSPVSLASASRMSVAITLTLADFNGDSIVDFVTGQHEDLDAGAAFLFSGDGLGNFTYQGEAYDINPLQEQGWDMRGSGMGDAYDYDNDGFPDILTSSGFHDISSIHYCSGNDSGLNLTQDTLLIMDYPVVQDTGLTGVTSSPPKGFSGPEIFGVVAGTLNDWMYIVYFPTPNSLIIPSVVTATCDSVCKIQPINVNLSAAINGATIPLKIPAGVEICSLSTQGLMTEGWTFNGDVKVDSGFIATGLWNFVGDSIPAGENTVFNVFYKATADCIDSWYIHWDTALSNDARQLLFSDMNSQVLIPEFAFNSDSTEIIGYIPGDFDGDGNINVSDLTAMVDRLFKGGDGPCQIGTSDPNGDCNPLTDGEINIGDLTYFIAYLFQGGPAPLCACAGAPVSKVANNDYHINTSYDGKTTTIEFSSAYDIRGLQLELTGVSSVEPVNLHNEKLELPYNYDNGVLKLGLLDLDGGEIVMSGTHNLIQLAGEFEIQSAILSDMNHNSITPLINVASKETLLPTEFALHQNYPNPFNPSTEIAFSLPVAGEVKLEIFNIMGQSVTTLANGYYEAGQHVVSWDGSNTASGIYFYRLTAGEFVETKKMLLLK